MNRVVYPDYSDRERREVWCEEHVMTVYADEWEEHCDEYH